MKLKREKSLFFILVWFFKTRKIFGAGDVAAKSCRPYFTGISQKPPPQTRSTSGSWGPGAPKCSRRAGLRDRIFAKSVREPVCGFGSRQNQENQGFQGLCKMHKKIAKTNNVLCKVLKMQKIKKTL